MPTVVITAPPSYYNIYAESNSPSILAVSASPLFGSARLPSEYYWDYLEFVAAVNLNPLTSPDVRCNVRASDASKITTSQHELTDRFLAAQQIFAEIRSYDNAMSLRGLLQNNPSFLYNGRRQFTFEVIYADGGREFWVVENELTAKLVPFMNVPNSLVQGDGTVKSCPGSGRGANT